MGKVKRLILIVALLLVVFPCLIEARSLGVSSSEKETLPADIAPVPPRSASYRYNQAVIYLVDRLRGIGLMDSYVEDGENRSYTYDNALAIFAFLNTGKQNLAEEIIDTFESQVDRHPLGAFHDSYSLSGNYWDPTAGSGPNSWLLASIIYYMKVTNTTGYLSLAEEIAQYLLTLQDPNDGGLFLNEGPDVPKSTECNLAAYIAFNNLANMTEDLIYREAADRIRDFLIYECYSGERFARGKTAGGIIDWDPVTDCQALGVLVFGPDYSSALYWAEDFTKTTVEFEGGFVTGFDFDWDRDTVWIEGTLQMAHAFFRCEDNSNAGFYFLEAQKTQRIRDPNPYERGALLLATNEGTAGVGWWLMPWKAVAPTTWYLLFYRRINPLQTIEFPLLKKLSTE